MRTEVDSVDADHPDPAAIGRAAAVLRGGGLVAFPTETVYGLGANALDAAAVAGIFTAKGRPATNPVIVHIADPSDVFQVAAVWPESAARLAECFWPGPLTIIVEKRPEVPEIVTAGGPTVAIRCPAHPVAQALIRAAGVPLAAPSANRSTELSPTRHEHVLSALDGRIDMLLDAGPCPGGLESTVVDAAGERIRLLRHGLIAVPQLEQLIGRVDVVNDKPGEAARSPGQMAKHYSPRTELRLVEGESLVDDLLEAAHAGKRVGSVLFHGEGFWPERAASQHVSLPSEAGPAAALLYDTLYRLDRASLDLILVEAPPDGPEWAAIRDRLTRAAAI